MDIIQNIRSRAKVLQERIVFPESRDPRVLRAARFLAEENICFPVLTGRREETASIAGTEQINLRPDIQFIDPRQFAGLDELTTYFYERRKHKEITFRDAETMLLENPLLFGAVLTAKGYVDGAVAGAVAATGEVIKAAVQGIGPEEGASIISSTFLMVMPDGKVFTFGDCGVVPYPDAVQLADIAIRSARTHKLLTNQEPVTALLSFSTKGSALHDRVELVKEALHIAREKAPDLTIDGELQFDAAIIPEIALQKAPGSAVAGKANVFIFPNLDAGNIAYKITERLAGAAATGPILQGLAKPMMDVSRGCRWQDIVNAACVAVLMGGGRELGN